MTGRLAMIDGALIPLEQATVSVLDRGFLYGDSVFETIRTYGGRPFALEAHLSRLARSAALVHIDLPVSVALLGEEIDAAVCAAGNSESYVRVMISRGTGDLGLDPALAGKPLRVIIVAPLRAPPDDAYDRGIGAVTFATRRVADGTDAEGTKIGNYLVSVLAMRAALAGGAAEALILDGKGRVVEGATSNVFFVKDGAIVTPPEDAGILPGITRGLVLDVCAEAGLRVAFDAPRAVDLATYDEVFISSSIREVLPVVQIDGVAVGTGAPGEVFRRLLLAFRRRAHAIG